MSTGKRRFANFQQSDLTKQKGEMAMGNERVREILDEAWRLFETKNKLYAGEEQSSSLGLVKLSGIEPWEGAVVILADKTGRLLTLRKANDTTLGPAIKDTFTDIINYSALGLELYEEFLATGRGNTKREKKDRPRPQRGRRKKTLQPPLPYATEESQTEQVT
jgi:hypothetical protein